MLKVWNFVFDTKNSEKNCNLELRKNNYSQLFVFSKKRFPMCHRFRGARGEISGYIFPLGILKRLKTYIRDTIERARLKRLDLINISWNIQLKNDEVLNELGTKARHSNIRLKQFNFSVLFICYRCVYHLFFCIYTECITFSIHKICYRN